MRSLSPSRSGAPSELDVAAVRDAFPALHQEVHGRPLVYMDSSASTLKPRRVIDAVCAYYERDHANVHRATHELARRATEAYEGARARVASYIGAPEPRGVVFTGGNTDALNTVAWSLGGSVLGPGDRVVLTLMEHHSDIVPWQMVCERTGAEIVVAPLTEAGEIDLEAFEGLLDERVKVVGLPWVSNVLGTVNPVAEIASRAHKVGAKVVVDGAQCVPHAAVDVEASGIDFLTMAGHKAFGPTGIGVLWGRPEVLDGMAPMRGGGEMVETVAFEGSEYAKAPGRFEAGTPNIAGAVGLGEALSFVEDLGLGACIEYERRLTEYGMGALDGVAGLTLYGRARERAPVFSFSVEGCHPYDMAAMLDRMGVAVRTGHHCAMPLTESLGEDSTLRASLAIYNTTEEIDRLVESLEKAREMLS